MILDSTKMDGLDAHNIILPFDTGDHYDYALFDTHAHYDHELYEGKGPELLQKLYKAKIIDGVVIPAVKYESNFNRYRFPERRFPYVYFGAGIHPKCASFEEPWDEEKTEEFLKLFDDHRTVAVKTGLDYSNRKLTEEQKNRQREFFLWLIHIAESHNLPLILHIRDAFDDAITILRERRKPKVEIVVHCFTYGMKEALEFMDVGVKYFGLGGMITRNMEHLRDCVRELPLSAILVETDSPLVRPNGYNGKFNTSATLFNTVEQISILKGISVEEVADAVQKNARSFYRLKE